MKRIAFSLWLGALFCAVAGGCVAQAPTAGQEPTDQPREGSTPNLPVPVSLTCGEFRAFLKAGDRQTSGLTILWLDGYYSGRTGVTELPAGWVRTVSQGIGGICAICVNEGRTVLDVIGQLHREYGGQK